MSLRSSAFWAQLVERLDLEVEWLLGGAAPAVWGDDDAVDLATDAWNFDGPRV
jgi:hypothetical protein